MKRKLAARKTRARESQATLLTVISTESSLRSSALEQDVAEESEESESLELLGSAGRYGLE